MAAAIRLASPEDAAAVVSIYAPYVTDTSAVSYTHLDVYKRQT